MPIDAFDRTNPENIRKIRAELVSADPVAAKKIRDAERRDMELWSKRKKQSAEVLFEDAGHLREIARGVASMGDAGAKELIAASTALQAAAKLEEMSFTRQGANINKQSFAALFGLDDLEDGDQ